MSIAEQIGFIDNLIAELFRRSFAAFSDNPPPTSQQG